MKRKLEGPTVIKIGDLKKDLEPERRLEKSAQIEIDNYSDFQKVYDPNNTSFVSRSYDLPDGKPKIDTIQRIISTGLITLKDPDMGEINFELSFGWRHRPDKNDGQNRKWDKDPTLSFSGSFRRSQERGFKVVSKLTLISEDFLPDDWYGYFTFRVDLIHPNPH